MLVGALTAGGGFDNIRGLSVYSVCGITFHPNVQPHSGAMANEVTVLVRFGTQCRLVTFLAEEGYEKLNAAIRKVYSDILSDEQR